jgi:hypothetical protein
MVGFDLTETNTGGELRRIKQKQRQIDVLNYLQKITNTCVQSIEQTTHRNQHNDQLS